MKYYFSFDTESRSLFGEPFAVGWVIVDQDGDEREWGYLAAPVEFTTADQWVVENVLPVLPDDGPVGAQYANCPDEAAMLTGFWAAWTSAKDRYLDIQMVVDCPWPVESGFLHRVQQAIGFGMENSPYPIIDVASVLLAAGYDPLGSYSREPAEEPAHNPVCDARQSVRIALEVLQEIARDRSLGIAHGHYGPLITSDGSPLGFTSELSSYTIQEGDQWGDVGATTVTIAQEDDE